ncbi:ATP synthase subunit B [Methylacidiphilum kamchatkense Kam1]|uniref:ATP synthase subunit b n=1 Tax=Methylacidiphilum kamchatkense Kam1 TaxID=1202785 RepID=A0A0C1RU46_9BACT|nr:F0F1 ATP synthase subunit B [Methylacidiphilum kamchatkense]KIE58511.1 ATP synthase subunit B [Methylacidiphilum kamchatkense Kam1]QDQ43328.1 F-type H+-transporting ATPase subunit b [Methylacidiphilum kamchatkense Kam1]
MENTLHQLGIEWNKLIAQIINFVIVLWVLNRFAFRPVLKILEQRREKIAESLQNAEKIKQELAAAEEARKEILRKANEQAAMIVAEAQKAAAYQGEKKILEAIEEAKRILKKAEETARLEREKAKEEIRREILNLVIDISSKVIGKTLSAEDQERLKNEVLSKIPQRGEENIFSRN